MSRRLVSAGGQDRQRYRCSQLPDEGFQFQFLDFNGHGRGLLLSRYRDAYGPAGSGREDDVWRNNGGGYGTGGLLYRSSIAVEISALVGHWPRRCPA